jgi:hypothetical protein
VAIISKTSLVAKNPKPAKTAKIIRDVKKAFKIRIYGAGNY